MISIAIEDINGKQELIAIPEGIQLNLMEVLKASGNNILAMCGGMALCATCLVEVISGIEKLPPPNDQELNILETLPGTAENLRLSCQIKIGPSIDGIVFRIR